MLLHGEHADAKTVYRLHNGEATVVVDSLRTPAQIGYDAKRHRLLVPQLKENRVMIFLLADAGG